jgi:Mn2+/Fe2+ NRAMP family transporter
LVLMSMTKRLLPSLLPLTVRTLMKLLLMVSVSYLLLQLQVVLLVLLPPLVLLLLKKKPRKKKKKKNLTLTWVSVFSIRSIKYM